MATISEIPGIYAYIRRMVIDEQRMHQDVSRELRRSHPTIRRGLSARSVARFCERHNIHSTSRITDQDLDNVVQRSVRMVRGVLTCLTLNLKHPSQNSLLCSAPPTYK